MKNLKLPYFKIESFGAVDGPGIRLVIFSQGCLLRCKYCHNPESWDVNAKVNSISINEIIALYRKNQSFYAHGGITLSGGEPLIHLDFCLALAQRCQQEGIHLCLDTSACNFNSLNLAKYQELVKLVPLWLVDIKHINPNKFESITGAKAQNEIKFIKFLEENKAHYWARQVLLKGYTDDEQDLKDLGKFLKTLRYMDKFELLPYHNMAISKYQDLKIKYPLEGILPPTQEDINRAISIINESFKKN